MRSTEKPDLNLHFLVLPMYSRYNDQAPLSVDASLPGPQDRDLLYFPLGIAQVANSLRRSTSHDIHVLDPYAQYVGMRELRDWLARTYSAERLPDPDYVLMGGLSTSWSIIKTAARIVKELFPAAKLICGGTVATLHGDLLLKNLNFDIVVMGEAEQIIVDLFDNLEDLSSVAGIAYRDPDGSVCRTVPAAPPDLNLNPVPAWDLFDVDEYVLSNRRHVGFRGLPMNTSMGCPYSCKFCFVPGGKRMRYLDPDVVVQRMMDLKSKFQLDYVAFYDDIMFVDKQWMWDLGTKIIDSGLRIQWTCSSRVNLFSERDRDLLRLLRRSGLSRIAFGIESASPTVLKKMGKTGVSPESARVALREVRRCGIRGTANFILGYPGETPNTIGETVAFCKENLLHPSFYLLQPFPGTEVYEEYVRDRYSEEEYLELMEGYREGERFPINLTSIPDAELVNLRDQAEREMRRFSLIHYLHYHKLAFPRSMVGDLAREFRRWYMGNLFVTP